MALIVGLALTGCTQAESGEPVAAGQQPPASGAPPASGNASLPPRPKDLPLDGVDPCKLFSKPQLDEIKVNRTRNLVQDNETNKGAPVCAMDGADGNKYFTFSTWVITGEGVEVWLNTTRNAVVTQVKVDGFPAVSYRIRGPGTFHCWTSVGVANGQQLAVEFRATSRGAFTQDQMCAKSEQAATLAMQTLKTLK
nr:DUF3558 domain-containing protein [Kibdelosporangium sp. MJ126-NF4]CEL15767.1 hypothetical protein [Kibdelosporangium sp. MJ126-NF4]CTQ93693.1 hypothetical protein [Kibdelosporangium sp. MJ126-NF4]